VIIEDGAHPLDTFNALGECEETVMVRQAALGPSIVAIDKVIQRIELLEQSARSVDSAVVVIAPRLDAQAITTRRELLCALLRRFQEASHQEPTEIVLLVDGSASLELRESLMTLMEELLGLMRGRSVLIRIRFGKVAEDDDHVDAWRSAS
jgi:hypothetical protein